MAKNYLRLEKVESSLNFSRDYFNLVFSIENYGSTDEEVWI